MPPIRKFVIFYRMEPGEVEMLRARYPQLEIVAIGRDFEALLREIPEAEIVYGPVRREAYLAAKRLRFIQVTSQGVDWMQYPELVDGPVVVANGAGLWSGPMAEHIIAIILAFYRQLRPLIEHQDRHAWLPREFPMDVLRGKTVGFLGTGSIAQACLPLLAAFGADAAGWSRSGRPVAGFSRVYPREALESLCAGADVVVNTLPLTEETRHAMGAAQFTAMRPSGLFINVGRGATVDEAALLHALDAGQIAGAGLDVFEEEPLPASSPFWDRSNVLITAHRAGLGSPDIRARILDTLCSNLDRYLAGEPLLNVVDKRAGY